MTAKDFGIYILTYPGDFKLSRVLVASIRRVSPDLPIMIIPGEGFDLDDHPFDVPVMRPPDGFWGRIGHKDRDFWAFQGPFETFLYLDADTLCVRSLDSVAERIASQPGKFLYVQPFMKDSEWLAVTENPAHPDHAAYREMVRSEVGRGPLERFDPSHDFFGHCPFNTGAFGSRRLTIRESDIEDLVEEEKRFFRTALHTEWSWESRALFFYDQGRLNYLAHKLSIPVYPIEPDLECRSGASALHITPEGVDARAYDFHILHWMGAMSPSPSLFCSGPLFSLYAFLWFRVGAANGRWVQPGYDKLPECTGYSLWRHYYEKISGRLSLRERLRSSRQDVARVAKLAIRYGRLKAGRTS